VYFPLYFETVLEVRIMQYWIFLGALNGLLALLAGAYGWHGLEATSGGRAMFKIGAEYHLWHALALFAIAWLSTRAKNSAALLVRIAGWAFLIGIVLFSGSLYLIGFLGYPPLPGTAPAGGIGLMIGWIALIAAAFRIRE